MTVFCLEVQGDFACFTRPEMKVERVSYDVITPSAARAVFEAIFWKPGIRWRVLRIDVLKRPQWVSLRRNEVGAVASVRNAQVAMSAGWGDLALYIEEERQQRAGLFLRDVAYRLYAELELCSDEARAHPGKYLGMFSRRAQAGQCVNQPYLGCREFAAHFRLVPLSGSIPGVRSLAQAELPATEPVVTDWTDDLGWMLYDLDYTHPGGPQAQFFRAQVENGVLNLQGVEVRG